MNDTEESWRGLVWNLTWSISTICVWIDGIALFICPNRSWRRMFSISLVVMNIWLIISARLSLIHIIWCSSSFYYFSHHLFVIYRWKYPFATLCFIYPSIKWCKIIVMLGLLNCFFRYLMRKRRLIWVSEWFPEVSSYNSINGFMFYTLISFLSNKWKSRRIIH